MVKYFFPESNGQCFFCLKTDTNIFNESISAQPIQYFSNILKIDRTKVFSEKIIKKVPPIVLTNVEKSILKVELCQECSILNGKCSELFEKLERIEMEVGFYLNAVYSKLTRKVKEEINYSEGEIKDGGKYEVFERLREETLKKCSLKLLQSHVSKVKIEKLTEEEISLSKLKTNFDLDQPVLNAENCHFQQIDKDAVKIEYDSESENDFDDTNDINYDKNEEDVKIGDKTEEKTIQIVFAPAPAKNNKLGVPQPIRIFGKLGSSRNMSTVNPVSGKHTCSKCSREFNYSGNFHAHYNKVHLKLRFKCSLCDWTGVERWSYKMHYSRVHLGNKFPCGECGKEFEHYKTRQEHLKKCHQKSEEKQN